MFLLGSWEIVAKNATRDRHRGTCIAPNLKQFSQAD